MAKRRADEHIQGLELKKTKHNDLSIGVSAAPASEVNNDSGAVKHDSNVPLATSQTERVMAVPKSPKKQPLQPQRSTHAPASKTQDNHVTEPALTPMQMNDLKRRLNQLQDRCRALQDENDVLQVKNQELEELQQEDNEKTEALSKQIRDLTDKARQESPKKEEIRKLKMTNKQLTKERDEANKGWRETYDELQSTRIKLDAAEQKADEYMEKARANVNYVAERTATRTAPEDGTLDPKKPVDLAAITPREACTSRSNTEETVQGHRDDTNWNSAPGAEPLTPAHTIPQPSSMQAQVAETCNGTSADSEAEATPLAGGQAFFERLTAAAEARSKGTIPASADVSSHAHSMPGLSEKARGKRPMYEQNEDAAPVELEPSSPNDTERSEGDGGIGDESFGSIDPEEQHMKAQQDIASATLFANNNQQDQEVYLARPAHIEIHINTLNVQGDYIVGSTDQQIASAILKAHASGIGTFDEQLGNTQHQSANSGLSGIRSADMDDPRMQQRGEKIHTSTDDLHTTMDALPDPYPYDVGASGSAVANTIEQSNRAGYFAGDNEVGDYDRDAYRSLHNSDFRSVDSPMRSVRAQSEYRDPPEIDLALDAIVEEGEEAAARQRIPRGPRNSAQHNRRGPRRNQTARMNNRAQVPTGRSPIVTRSHTSRENAGGNRSGRGGQRPGARNANHDRADRIDDAGIRRHPDNRRPAGRPNVRGVSQVLRALAKQQTRPQHGRRASTPEHVDTEHESIDHYASDRAAADARRQAGDTRRARNGRGARTRM